MKKAGVPLTPLRTPPMKSLLTFCFVSPPDQRLPQRRFRQTQSVCQRQQERHTELILVLVDAVMHLPEPAEAATELRRLSRDFGIRMDLAQRKVAEREADIIAKMLTHQVDDGICRRAMRTFVIAVLDYRDGRGGRPEDMVMRREWHFERRHENHLLSSFFPVRPECRPHRG